MQLILQTATRIRNAITNGIGLSFELARAGLSPEDWDEFVGDKEGTCKAVVAKQGKQVKQGTAASLPKVGSK